MVIKEEERGISLRRLKTSLAVAAMALTATMESQHLVNDQEDYLMERALKLAASPLGGLGDVVKSWNTLLRIRRGHHSKCARVVEAFVDRLLRSGTVTDCDRKTFDHIQLAYRREKYFVRDASGDVRENLGSVGDGGESCGGGASGHCSYREGRQLKLGCCYWQ